MKFNIFTIFFIFLLILRIYSQDQYYEIVKKTVPTFLPDYLEPLIPGDIVFPTYSHAGFNVLSEGADIDCSSPSFPPPGYATIIGNDLHIKNSDRFANKILALKNDVFWIPSYYLFPLLTNNRNDLSKYKQEIDDKFAKYENTEIILIDNLVLMFDPSGGDLSYFFTINIKDITVDYYRVDIIPKITTSSSESYNALSALLDPFENGKPYTLYIHHNENKLRFYLDGMEEPIWDLIKVSKDFNDYLEEFLDSNLWPATKDWQDYLAPDILEDWPVKPLSEIKKEFYIPRPSAPSWKTIQLVSFYSMPYKSDDTKMGELGKGYKLYHLESGSYAILDEKKAPWIHVETEDGTRCWVWGGFLEKLPNALFPPEKTSHRVLEKLRLRETSDTSSPTITIMEAGLKVLVLETGETETIDGITAPWVRVKTVEGQEGWCFGGYLEDLETGKRLEADKSAEKKLKMLILM
ncbi:MAG: SH3 domain-containing protein [Spirochaetales bacterium]|nr:SH3 domain-containing protein [Spirochaetales bacterium]